MYMYYIYICICTHIYMYTYVYVYVCICTGPKLDAFTYQRIVTLNATKILKNV